MDQIVIASRQSGLSLTIRVAKTALTIFRSPAIINTNCGVNVIQ